MQIFNMLAGDVRLFRATPKDAHGNVSTTTGDPAWSTDRSDLVALAVDSSDKFKVAVTAIKAGSAVLTITAQVVPFPQNIVASSSFQIDVAPAVTDHFDFEDVTPA